MTKNIVLDMQGQIIVEMMRENNILKKENTRLLEKIDALAFENGRIMNSRARLVERIDKAERNIDRAKSVLLNNTMTRAVKEVLLDILEDVKNGKMC